MKNKLDLIQKGFLLMVLLFFNAVFSQENEDLHANLEGDNMVILEPSYSSSKANESFEDKYHYIIARSYFKLLDEAHKSERKLKLELERYVYENQNFDRNGDDAFQHNRNLAYAKYKAHTTMLSGLKSWNLLSDFRTGDMFYFMLENEDPILKMFKENVAEDKMVNYLIYKLANLYHLEGEN